MPDDARVIAAIHAAAWNSAYGELLAGRASGRLTLPEQLSRWEWLLDEQSSTVETLVADDAEGTGVGFCSFTSTTAPEVLGEHDAIAASEEDAELLALYVRPRCQRHGYGTMLLEACTEALRSRGCRSVGLWVFSENISAQSFYRRYGFSLSGHTGVHQPTGVEVVQMCRPLDS